MGNVRLITSEPQQKVYDSRASRTLMLSGVGSGKTHIGGLKSGYFIRNFPQVRGFIGANTYEQLSKSTLAGIFKVWSEYFGWEEGVNYVVDKQPPAHFKKYTKKLKTYMNTISFDNGAMIFVSSLENYKAIDGTEFAWAILDETKDTREEAVKEVIIARLRQVGMWVSGQSVFNKKTMDLMVKQRKVTRKYIKNQPKYYNNFTGDEIKGYNPLYILTSPAKVQWINEWFEIDQHLEEISQKIFSKTDFYDAHHGNSRVVISSTYHNEHNLSAGYIDNLIDGYKHNPQLVNMMIYGSPVAKSGGEWFSRFSREVHVKTVKYNNDYPVHISLDFNVVPYMTLLVSQFIPDKVSGRMQWNTLKEYTLASPKNNTEDICNEFLYDYAGQIKGLFYTGDPSGAARQTVSKDVKHNFHVVDQVLRMYCGSYSNRVPTSAPSLSRCRDFFNRMLNGGFNIDVNIDPSCKHLISDMEFLKEDVNGGYVKKKVKDKNTGETYEKHGHCADAWRYQGVSTFDEEFAKYEIM